MMDMQTPMLSGAQPVKSELSVNQDNDNLVTLVHTVSFYRRQQSANVSYTYLLGLTKLLQNVFACRAPIPHRYARYVASSR